MEELTKLESAALEEMRQGQRVSIFHPSDVVANACASLVRKGYAEIDADGLSWVPTLTPNLTGEPLPTTDKETKK